MKENEINKLIRHSNALITDGSIKLNTQEDSAVEKPEQTPDIVSSGCASHLSHPGCIKNADRSAGTGDGTIFAVRRA